MRLRNGWIAVSVLWPAAAWAGGYYASDLGAVAGARAGAFVARADDLTAAWYNPAGLATGEHGWRLLVDAAGFFSFGDYTRQCPAATGGCGPLAPAGESAFPTVSNGAAPLPIPTLVLAHDIGPRGVIAASLIAPYGPAYSYPSDPNAPQRYSLIENTPFLAYYTISGAYRLNDRVQVGASFQWVDFSFSQTLVASAFLKNEYGSNPEDTAADATIKLEGADHFTPAGNFGVKVRATDQLEVGAALQLGFTTHNDSTLSAPGLVAFNKMYSNPAQQLHLSPTSPTATVDISLPMVGRAGVRWLGRRGDVELDAVYEGWHTNEGWVIAFAPNSLLIRGPGSTGNQLPNITIPKKFQDCFSARLGGDWSVWGDPRPGGTDQSLTLRGGAFFESSAVPSSNIDVSQVDGNKVGVSIGAGYRTGRWDVDLMYTHVQVFQVDASDNQNLQINAWDMTGNHSDLIAKGLYSAHYEIVGVGLRTKWGL